MLILNNYPEAKKAGLVSIVKVGDAFAATVKKFSPDTGLEVSPEVVAIDVKQLEEQKKNLEGQVVILSQLIADLQSL